MVCGVSVCVELLVVSRWLLVVGCLLVGWLLVVSCVLCGVWCSAAGGCLLVLFNGRCVCMYLRRWLFASLLACELDCIILHLIARLRT